jgi:hypothetical protein
MAAVRDVLTACCLIGFVLAAPAYGQDAATAPDAMKSPQLTAADVDWNAVRTSLADLDPLKEQDGAGAPDALTRLNAASAKILPDIAASPVPVLLPFDTAGLLRDAAQGATGDASKYLSGLRTATLFFPGPSGYDAELSLRKEDAPDLNLTYARPVNIQISGSSLLYELDGSVVPASDQAAPVAQLDGQFPGIRRVLVESHLRYTFVRYGVPYFVSIECFDGGNSSRRLSCREADKVALRFLKALNIVGGAPPVETPKLAPEAIERPENISPDFTYFAPGDILPGTGWRGHSGRPDRTVYANIRFPMAQAPAYTNSQSFMNWGNCDMTGRVGLGGRGNSGTYRCRVNDKPLVNDEAKNYAYPWRDNFCEHRGWSVSQCPAGVGHQGEDIRPGTCLERVPEAGRCSPYQNDLVAVSDGILMRSPGNLALYLVVDRPGVHIRFRYLHMDPQMLDAAGMVSGRRVTAGEVLGAASNYEREAGGTTYHLHFDAQVPTKDGWVFVNPYMTLVASYEHLIGARGTVVNDAMFAPPPAVAVTDKQTPPADGTIVAANPDAKRPVDGAPKIEAEPKADHEATEEHCTVYVYRGRRHRSCHAITVEATGSGRHTHVVRATGRHVSRQASSPEPLRQPQP